MQCPSDSIGGWGRRIVLSLYQKEHRKETYWKVEGEHPMEKTTEKGPMLLAVEHSQPKAARRRQGE